MTAAALDRPVRLAEFLDGADPRAAQASYMRAWRWWERLGLADRIPPGRRGPGSRVRLTEREALAIATACVVADGGNPGSTGQRRPIEAGERAGLAVLATTGGYLLSTPTAAFVVDDAEAALALWIGLGRPTATFLNLTHVPTPGDPR